VVFDVVFAWFDLTIVELVRFFLGRIFSLERILWERRVLLWLLFCGLLREFGLFF
jgi:hypothetical protein